MSVLAIDYETYYSEEYSMSIMDNLSYVNDSRFNAYVVSVFDKNISKSCHPKDLDWENISRSTWVSHNMSFDRAVHMRLIELGEIPCVIPDKWYCSLDLCAFMGYPSSLKDACKHVLGLEVDKSIRSDMKGFKPGSTFPFYLEQIYAYASRDAELCYLLWEKLEANWPNEERDLSIQTSMIGERGVFIDQEELETQRDDLELSIYNLKKSIPWRDRSPLFSDMECKNYCINKRVPIPETTDKNSKQFKKWADEYADKAPALLLLGKLRSENKKFKLIKTIEGRLKNDSTASYCMKYCGTHTGRWTCYKKFNVLTLDKEGARKMISSKPGRVLSIYDYAQIEPRVLAWILKDDVFLGYIRKGIDPYETYARINLGYDDDRPLKAVNPKLRNLCKAIVIGLCYGISYNTFKKTCSDMYGVDISLEESKEIVFNYRRDNPKTVTFWRNLDRSIANSYADKKDLTLKLPSGRCLYYRDIGKCPKGGKGYTAKVQGRTTFIWGSKICENVVQAAARDVMASGLLRLKDYLVRFHCHDEVILEVDENDPEVNDRIKGILKDPPHWCPDLPLDVEMIQSKHYTK